jgi:hypothetical protein
VETWAPKGGTGVHTRLEGAAFRNDHHVVFHGIGGIGPKRNVYEKDKDSIGYRDGVGCRFYNAQKNLSSNSVSQAISCGKHF